MLWQWQARFLCGDSEYFWDSDTVAWTRWTILKLFKMVYKSNKRFTCLFFKSLFSFKLLIRKKTACLFPSNFLMCVLILDYSELWLVELPADKIRLLCDLRLAVNHPFCIFQPKAPLFSFVFLLFHVYKPIRKLFWL